MIDLSEKEIEVLKLLKEDTTYQNYFFKKVKDIKWFYPLKRAGYFNPEKAPAPIEVKNGYQMPFWAPLNYLEIISIEIKNGNYKGYINDILEIISGVSKQPSDNHLTWYYFLKILQNLPNENISNTILDNIPTWLNSRFNKDLLSNDICEKLLPKFLNENSTKEDISKAEAILRHIFTIKKNQINKEKKVNIFDTEGEYGAIVDTYWLKNALIDKKQFELIAKYCSNGVIFVIAQNMKKMLLDFPNGLSIKVTIQNINYLISAYINEKDLKIIAEKESDKAKIEIAQISNFENKDENILLDELIEKINIEIPINGDKQVKNELKKIVNSLNNDLSTIWCDDISKIEDKFIHGSDPKVVFTLILRNILNLKAKIHKEQTKEIINSFNNDTDYKLPFFKRISLYTISENWDDYSSFFWNMNSLEKNLFSEHSLDKEIYNLLKKNVAKFFIKEKEIIKEIILLGPKNIWLKEENYKEYWQLKWLSAVKVDDYFISYYKKLFEKLKISSEDYENVGVIKTFVGPVSEDSAETLLKMTNLQIVQTLLEFKPKDKWYGPSREGLGRALEQAIIKDPALFANEIYLYKHVNYLYSYHIIWGFTQATPVQFNWEKVLTFCKDYITQDDFKNNKLGAESDLEGAKPEWVIGAIGNLITKGTQYDNEAFKESLLPLALELFSIIVPNLKPINEVNHPITDYPTYSLNSTSGKVLRAMLDYALKVTRLKKNNKDEVKWTSDIKALFQSAIDKKILDVYIIQGQYIWQFDYLDKNWTRNYIIKYYDIEDEYWFAFMGGYEFAQITNYREIYDLMIPHYKRAIKSKIELNRLNKHGIIRHIAVYYLWGYEEIGGDNIITLFLNTSNANQINTLISFLDQYKSQIDFHKVDEKAKNERIIILWEHILNRFQTPIEEEDFKLISSLSKLIVFFNAVSEKNFELLSKSAKYIDYDYNDSFLIEELGRLKDKGNQEESAKYVGKILSEILVHTIPYYEQQQEHIISIIKFLYKFKSIDEINQLATDICNKCLKSGLEFLRPIFNENN